MSDPGVPAQQADAVAVAVVLARRAKWDAGDLDSRVADLWVKARMVDPPGKPLAHVTDPFALEVHHAISTDLPGKARDLPVLPAYVERAHDARLRALAVEAAGGTSQLAVLTGASSTGRTRACWEVLHQLPKCWRLWPPYDPTCPEAALAAIEHLAPRTVVWFNEAQHYLLTGSDLGKRLAAKLRTLLTDSSRPPVLVLGTMWHWSKLTAVPKPSDDDPLGVAEGQRQAPTVDTQPDPDPPAKDRAQSVTGGRSEVTGRENETMHARGWARTARARLGTTTTKLRWSAQGQLPS
ncbi:hypothetical protein [Streptomyces levis]|uniref:hypothetical protein n=1 Tax=Streptomyces levis TaxID=285566 RepID=UPI003C7CBEC7